MMPIHSFIVISVWKCPSYIVQQYCQPILCLGFVRISRSRPH